MSRTLIAMNFAAGHISSQKANRIGCITFTNGHPLLVVIATSIDRTDMKL